MTGTIKISELNAAASLTGTEEVPIVAGGATKRTTTLAIAGLATASTNITVGTTPIANGNTSRVLYDNNGVLGEYTISGTGSVVMSNSPSLITPALGVPTSLTLTNAAGLPIGGISATGTPSASTFLRGDGTWSTPAGSGTVTSVSQSFTGGLISSSGSPVTTSGTLALTVAGTSGGIPYFSSSSTWASSGALAANALVIGGGAGVAPSTTTTGTGVLTALGINVGSAGAFVTFNGALGTPSSGTLTNATGLPVASGISGFGTGVATALAVNVGSAGAFVTFNGALGTPSSATLTNATGLPISSGVSGLGTGIATFLATPSSANLASAVTDETGSGALVFANTPTLVTPVLGAATGSSVSVTGALTAYSGTAIPAGGTTGSGIKLSSTSNFGVFFGVGAPTLSAAQGAIYLRSDGTSSTGVYTNTDGATTWAAIGGGGGGSPGGSSGQVQYNNAGAFGGAAGFTFNGTATLTLGVAATSTGSLVLSNATSGAATLTSDAANTLALRNSTNAQTFNVYNTYTDASNYERVFMRFSSNVAQIGNEKAGTGSFRDFEVVVSNSGYWTGNVLNVRQSSGAGAVGVIQFGTAGSGNKGYMDGDVLILRDRAGSGAALLAWGNSTSSFPALKRSSATLQTRLADDSDYAQHAAAYFFAGKAYTVATLPTGAVGYVARVTDASAPAVGSTVTGGGAAAALVWYNGSNYTVIGV